MGLDTRQNFIFTDNQNIEPPNSTVPNIAETTPRVVLKRALFSQGGVGEWAIVKTTMVGGVFVCWETTFVKCHRVLSGILLWPGGPQQGASAIASQVSGFDPAGK